MDNLSLFVDTLQELMLERNIKPDDIHKGTKINLAVIYEWLKKAAVPSVKSLILLSDFFQCSIDYLTGRSETKTYSMSEKKASFSERLRLLMNTKGVTVRGLSTETKIARSAISYFLNGSIEPLLDNLVKLAVFFDCSIDYLLGRSDKT